ncbi:MAG: hypoxanthine phosphoribosyltransferase [Anaerostipes sp.]|nr:hypoxanthine phosphoribosyltransferase [Anaerostipes sp.]
MGETVIRELISEEKVCNRINELGAQISKEYEGKELHIITILKGGVFFACELAKRISIPVSIDFMQVSSYGDSRESSGIVKISKDLDEPIEGKEVLIVEDIIDSGKTLSHLKPMLLSRKPASLRLCTLLNKPERREVNVPVEYIGFDVPDEFVVGYGLDFAQKYRNLPFVGVAEEQ